MELNKRAARACLQLGQGVARVYTSCTDRTASVASVCILHLISSTGVKTVDTATPEAIAHTTSLWTGMVSFGPS